MVDEYQYFIDEAIKEAEIGLTEGGIPIGSVLAKEGKIIGRGHNRRVQKGSAILHAEMDCLENAGRLSAKDYEKCTIYSTLSPCAMCTGAILLYKIPVVVIGENDTFKGPEELSQSQGVKIENLKSEKCVKLMKDFIREKPELWNEDIGEGGNEV
jgi:cytosine deaminase